MGLQNRFLTRLKDAIEPAKHDERQDDLAILGLLEVAAKRLGDLPDEAGKPVGLLCSLVVHTNPAPQALRPCGCEGPGRYPTRLIAAAYPRDRASLRYEAVL
jgi:hypothetical protein